MRTVLPSGRRGEAGMTMVEILLALGLLAVLSTFVVGTLTTVLDLWRTGEQRGRGHLVFTAASERLRQDLLALHTGPSGWLKIDQWQAVQPAAEEPGWKLPRLRFLASGAGLPLDDPTGRSAVEVAWLVVPEDASKSRLARLVRVTKLADGGDSLLDDRYLNQLVRGGGGLILLDGVAWSEFQVLDVDGQWKSRANIAPEAPIDFPWVLRLSVERVEGHMRRRPPQLDVDLSRDDKRFAMTGSGPFRLPDHALVGKEWFRVRGDFPRLNITHRGARETIALEHLEDTPVYFPEAFELKAEIAAGGRRRMP